MKYVYLIQVEGTSVYKIGFTKNNPKNRVKSLQTGNSIKLILIDSYYSKRATKIESVLHIRFASSKIDENEHKLMGEFFILDFETRTKFKEICKQIDDNFEIIDKMQNMI